MRPERPHHLQSTAMRILNYQTSCIIICTAIKFILVLNCLDLGLNGDNKVGKKHPDPDLLLISVVFLLYICILHI